MITQRVIPLVRRLTKNTFSRNLVHQNLKQRLAKRSFCAETEQEAPWITLKRGKVFWGGISTWPKF